jgi:LacI family transcriptional regulator
VVVKDFDDPFFGHVLGELQTLARRHQYALLLTGPEADDLAMLSKYAPGGLLLLGSDYEPEGLEAFLSGGKRAVRFGWGLPRKGLNCVGMDDAFGLGLLLDHLTGQGHRRFGFIGTDSALHQRRSGLFGDLLSSRGLTSGASFHFFPRSAAEAGREGLNRLWSLPAADRPTALVAADDLVAQGALRAAATRGLSIPRQLSLTGIDDLPSSELSVPALTTIRQPIRRMIRSAFARLLDEGRIPANDCRVRPELILRESTGPAPAPGA